MTRTPDEIKKGLEYCIAGIYDVCHYCAYYEVGSGDCVDDVKRDALALIQQLQAENTEKDERIQQLESDKQQLEGLLTHMNQLRDAAAGRALKMEERVHHLEAERDAAVAFLKGQCWACKFSDCSFAEEPCASCFADRREKWQWRGVQKEE